MTPNNEKGFILVTVLLVIAVLFPLILAFNSKVQLNLIQAENYRDSIQALRLARRRRGGHRGLEAGRSQLRSLRDDWSASFRRWPSARVRWRSPSSTRIRDTPQQPGGRTKETEATTTESESQTAANTAPAAKTQTTQAAQQTSQVDNNLKARLGALITRLEGKPEVADALADWLDTDSDVTGDQGAEDDYYRQNGYRCKNGALDSVRELSLVRGFEPDWLRAKGLSRFVTVAPTDGKVNVNTASRRSCIRVGTKTADLPQPLSESDIEELVRYRDQHDLKTVKDITLAVKISDDQAGKAGPLIKVNSAYFTITSKYTIGRVVKHVEALVVRNGDKVTVRSWREF